MVAEEFEALVAAPAIGRVLQGRNMRERRRQQRRIGEDVADLLLDRFRLAAQVLLAASSP